MIARRAHSFSRGLAGLALLVSLLGPGAASLLAQTAGTSTFQIRVPKRSGNFGISQVTATLTLSDDPAGGVSVQVTDPENQTVTLTAVPGGATDTQTFPAGGGSFIGDTVSLVPPPDYATSGGSEPEGARDPERFRYVLEIFPTGNLDFSTPSICPDTSAGAEDWTVTVLSTGGTEDCSNGLDDDSDGDIDCADSECPCYTGACLLSWDLNTSGAECAEAAEIQSTDTTQVASLLLGGTPTVEFCGGFRPAVDVVLVLDRSGSMDSPSLGSASRPKFSVLRDAVTDFVGEWTDLRASEASPPADQIGLVFFNANESVPVPLGSFVANSATVTSSTAAECGGTDPPNCSGSTSMGDGLEAAVSEFNFASANRKVILLMSNGKENTATRVAVDDTNNPTEVLLWETNPASTTPLFGTGQHARIYAVTIGTSTAVSADTNEDIARATGGFYINSEDDAELLRSFFLELLQNALRFNTWQTIHLSSAEVSATDSAQVRFPVSSTTRTLSVNVLWDPAFGFLRATLRPPGSGPITAAGNGAVRLSVPRPTNPPATADGDWVLEVEAERLTDLAASVPVDIVVQGDDLGLKADLSVAPSNYTPGDDIVVRARIAEAGLPLTQLGSDPDDRLLATVIKPGEAIGDLLAASDTVGHPEGDDPSSAADAKLQDLLENDPDSLVRVDELVELRDDGSAASGDAVAGDGIYSGLLEAREPGHYNVLFGVEGRSERSGRFARQRIESVHVRSVPEPDQTDVDSSITPLDGGGNRLTLDITPRTLFGHHMVGFGPYIWVTATGHAPVQAGGNLKGSYRAVLDFAGAVPDDVTIHFVETSTNLDASITADQLPRPLGDDTVLIDEPLPQQRPWSISLHAGGNDPRGSGLNGSRSLGLDLEYAFDDTFALELFLGHEKMNGSTAADPDLETLHVAVNGKAYFTSGLARPFVLAGLGVYDFSPGSAEFGFDLGAGVQMNVNRRLALEAAVKYHYANPGSSSFEFLTYLVGARIRF